MAHVRAGIGDDLIRSISLAEFIAISRSPASHLHVTAGTGSGELREALRPPVLYMSLCMHSMAQNMIAAAASEFMVLVARSGVDATDYDVHGS